MRTSLRELSRLQQERLAAPDWNARQQEFINPTPPGALQYYSIMRSAY